VEDWAEIRRLHGAEGMAVKAIARRMGVERNTVRAALRAVDPPRYARKPVGSVVDEVEPEVRGLLRETPEMPATVIAERIGRQRELTVLKERVGSCGASTGSRTRRRGPATGRASWRSATCGSHPSGFLWVRGRWALHRCWLWCWATRGG
jgi:transposase